MTTGQFIKKHLKLRGLTVSGAARIAKLDRPTLSDLANDLKQITIKSAMNLERGLGMDAIKLVEIRINDLRKGR